MSAMLEGKIRPLIYTALIAVLAYVGFAIWNGWDETLEAIGKLGVGGIGLVLGLSLLNYALRFVRWQWYLSRLGYQVPPLLSLRYYLAGFAFTTTPGKAGEAVRSLYLKRQGVPYPQSLSAFFVERLSDLAAIILLSSLGVWFFGKYLIFIVLSVALVALLILVLQSRKVRVWLRDAFVSRLPEKLAQPAGHALDMMEAAGSLLTPRYLWGGLGLGLLAWGAEGVAFYLIITMMGLPATFIAGVGIYSLGVTVGALSFLPGGLGSTEAVMILLLLALNIEQADAGAAVILCRLATLWFAVIIGAGVLMGLEQPKRVSQASDV